MFNNTSRKIPYYAMRHAGQRYILDSDHIPAKITIMPCYDY